MAEDSAIVTFVDNRFSSSILNVGDLNDIQCIDHTCPQTILHSSLEPPKAGCLVVPVVSLSTNPQTDDLIGAHFTLVKYD